MLEAEFNRSPAEVHLRTLPGLGISFVEIDGEEVGLAIEFLAEREISFAEFIPYGSFCAALSFGDVLHALPGAFAILAAIFESRKIIRILRHDNSCFL